MIMIACDRERERERDDMAGIISRCMLNFILSWSHGRFNHLLSVLFSSFLLYMYISLSVASCHFLSNILLLSIFDSSSRSQ